MNTRLSRLTHAAMAALIACASAHAVDSFDASMSLLTLESVNTGGVNYKNVAVVISGYTVLGVDGGGPVADNFNQATGILGVGAVAPNGTTYNNVRVGIAGYTLLNKGSVPKPGTQAVANSPKSTDAASFLATVNQYRSECGLPTLARNAFLDVATVPMSTSTGLSSGVVPGMARAAGYSQSSTVGALIAAYVSSSGDRAAVDKYIARVAMTDPYGTLATFPCANTTNTAPTTSQSSAQGVSYAVASVGALSAYGNSSGAQTIGTPIAVMAKPGDSLLITGASVTPQGVDTVLVTITDQTRSLGDVFSLAASYKMPYPYQGYGYRNAPLAASPTYNPVILGTVNGVALNKSYPVRTGAAILVNLP